MTQTLRALVIEDEMVSRDLLTSMLGETEWIEVAGVAGTVVEGAAAIGRHRPDLVFLDIRMPDGTGFDVIDAVGPDAMPPVVFVTAYDEYAVRAFEVMALDYLLKPFDEERLLRCVDRVRTRLQEGRSIDGARLLALLEELRAPRGADHADRLPVDAGTHMKLIPVAEIDWLEARGKSVLVHTRTSTYSMREGLSSVEARLDPRAFLRVHRSAVVRVDRVREIHRWTRGDYRLVLHDGTKIVTGPTYRKGVEARLLGERRPPVG